MAISVIKSLDVYCFSLVVLTIVACKTRGSPSSGTTRGKAFAALIAFNLLINVADALTILFDGIDGFPVRMLLYGANIFGFSLQAAICLCWFWYARIIVLPNKPIRKEISRLQAIPAVVCVVLAAASPFTGWFFSLDGSNAYHRGPLFPIEVGVSYLYVATGYALVLRHRANLSRQHFRALLIFAVPPAIGGVVQTLFYGVSLIWPGAAISLLLIYLALQNDLLIRDYLTGVNSRISLDFELNRKIAGADLATPFALLLVDIDNFRSINDRFGRRSGDEALIALAGILMGFFRKRGFVARYGGDEFAALVALESIHDITSTLDDIQDAVDRWNEKSGKPWKILVSLGAAPYIPEEGLNGDQFLMRVDKLLSLDKVVQPERRYRNSYNR